MAQATDSVRMRWRLVVFFGLLAVLFAPALAWLTRLPDAAGVPEMRALAAWPEWRAKSWDSWMAGYESWLDDHFPLRKYLIRWHSTVWHLWLGAPGSNVVVGRDNWLLYTGDSTIEDWQGRDLMSGAELDNWRRAAEGRQAWLRQRGIKYLLVFVPNKSTVYPEKLPLLLRTQRRPGKFEQILDYLRSKNSTVHVLDLRPALISDKAREIDYWPTDSHWNAHGLVTGSDAIMARLRGMDLGLPMGAGLGPMKIESVTRDGDCVGLLAMSGHWPRFAMPQLSPDPGVGLHAVQTPLSDLPIWKRGGTTPPVAFECASGVGRAVMLCDSFFRVGGLAADAQAQSPLAWQFHRFVSLWDWVGGDNLSSYDMILAIAEKEHPDVVIEEWTERYLRSPMPDSPEFARAREAAAP
jgi:hypothetical protein